MQHTNFYAPMHKSAPWPLLGIILVFMVPFLLAVLLYQFREEITFKYAQTGQLITPPLPIHTIPSLAPLLSHSSQKWQLIYLEPAQCDSVCSNRLDRLKRIHQALGKDQPRVQLHDIRLKKPIPLNNGYATENSILVADPRGFLIMIYPLDYPADSFNAKGLLKDIQRLLRSSHVG